MYVDAAQAALNAVLLARQPVKSRSEYRARNVAVLRAVEEYRVLAQDDAEYWSDLSTVEALMAETDAMDFETAQAKYDEHADSRYTRPTGFVEAVEREDFDEFYARSSFVTKPNSTTHNEKEI